MLPTPTRLTAAVLVVASLYAAPARAQTVATAAATTPPRRFELTHFVLRASGGGALGFGGADLAALTVFDLVGGAEWERTDLGLPRRDTPLRRVEFGVTGYGLSPQGLGLFFTAGGALGVNTESVRAYLAARVLVGTEQGAFAAGGRVSGRVEVLYHFLGAEVGYQLVVGSATPHQLVLMATVDVGIMIDVVAFIIASQRGPSMRPAPVVPVASSTRP